MMHPALAVPLLPRNMTIPDIGVPVPSNLEKSLVLKWSEPDNELSILSTEGIESDDAQELAEMGLQAWLSTQKLAKGATTAGAKPKLVRITTDTQEVCITGNIGDSDHLFVGVCRVGPP